MRTRKMERLKANFLFEENKELLAKMKEEYLNCPSAVKYVNSLKVPENLVDEEIVKIYDFVLDLNVCKKCPGVKNCPKSTPLLCTKITYKDGVVGRELVPCKEYLKQLKFERSFIVRDFDAEWLNSDLKHIDSTTSRKEAIAKYNSYFKGTTNEWLYLQGENGTGRTYLAANIAIDIAKKDRGPIAFLDVSARFKLLASKKDLEFKKMLDLWCQVPVLVLDDLGNEYKSDFVRENILFPILNNRAKNHLFTIITSDFEIADIATMYTTSQASKPKAEQIKRLLRRACGQEINQGDLGVY